MVDNIGNNNQQPSYIKLKGQDKKLDLNNLLGLKKTEKNKTIFDKFDTNKNGVIDNNEVQNLKSTLLDASGNTTLSKREANKKFGSNLNAFDAINSLAEQQKAFDSGKAYTENIDNKEFVYKKGEIVNNEATQGESYIHETTENGELFKYEDGSSKLVEKNGFVTENDGKGNITNYDDKGNKFGGITSDNKLITYIDNGNLEIISDPENNTIEKINYKENKREFSTINGNATTTEFYEGTEADATLSKIVVSNKNNKGHTVETTYNSKEDLENNRPSEEIIDGNVPEKTQVKTYTYKDGNVKIETKDGTGNTTETKYQNSEGKDIPAENFDKKELEIKTHTVAKGEKISTIVRNALKEQGITEPTDEQFKNAKKEFLELNKDKVKTYNGSNEKFKGNKFFYINEQVKIPNFNKTEKTEKPEETPPNEAIIGKGATGKLKDGSIDGGTLNEVVVTGKKLDPDVVAVKRFYEKELGDNYKLSYDNNGDIVVSNKDGVKLEAATQKANNKAKVLKQTKEILKYDANNDSGLDINEFKKLIYDNLNAGLEEPIYESDPEIDKLIEESFNNMNTNSKDSKIDRQEIAMNATKVLQDIGNSVNELEEQRMNAELQE